MFKTIGAGAKMITGLGSMFKTGLKQGAGKIRKAQLTNVVAKMMHPSTARKMARMPSSSFERGGLNRYKRLAKPLLHGKTAMGAQMMVGAAGMSAIAVMNGGMSAASNNMTARYMRDSRYSSKVLQSRVGKSSGNGALNIGNHTGLSLSLSRSRHG